MKDYSDPNLLASDSPVSHHWSSRALRPSITLQRRVRRASIGAQPHEFGSSFWRFSMALDSLQTSEVRALEADISKNAGLKPFLIYDRFRPYPAQYSRIPRSTRASAVSPVSLRGVSRAGQFVLLEGEAAEIVSVGDPFAYVFEGKRYYNRACETVKLDRGCVRVAVEKRPSLEVTSVDVKVERVRPCAAFALDFQSYSPPTGGKLKDAVLSGVEWTGPSE